MAADRLDGSFEPASRALRNWLSVRFFRRCFAPWRVVTQTGKSSSSPLAGERPVKTDVDLGHTKLQIRRARSNCGYRTNMRWVT